MVGKRFRKFFQQLIDLVCHPLRQLMRRRRRLAAEKLFGHWVKKDWRQAELNARRQGQHPALRRTRGPWLAHRNPQDSGSRWVPGFPTGAGSARRRKREEDL